MTRTLHTANRATRLRLRAALDLADHAAELLHNKEEALQRERTRLEGHVNRTEKQWHERAADATAWLLRARALGATTELATLSVEPPSRASIEIGWRTAMGVTYPGDVECTTGPPAVFTSTAALVPASGAFRTALTAGAEHAAAAAALRSIEAELFSTRRRRRAIEIRLQPRLESQLHDVDLRLDERDRDEALRTQLATRRRSTRR